MNTGALTNRTPLLAPALGPTTRSEREGLHSMLRRICEKNQLTVNTVLAGLVLPAIGTSVRQQTKMSADVHLINSGADFSRRLALRLEQLTTLCGLLDLTFCDLATLSGVARIPIAKHRKWCPCCFTSDVDTNWGPYDRLIWSIEAVAACPVHRVQLNNRCNLCGAGPFPVLVGRDISGRCPKCFAWLGGDAISLDINCDEYARFLIWTAKSFADVLDLSLPRELSASQGINKTIYAICQKHFDGNHSRFADAISRNKSVVCTWTNEYAAPSWQALLEISYVFQVPLPDILSGELDSIQFSSINTLPLGALDRLLHPRKQPAPIDIDAIRSFFIRVELGEFSHLLTMKAVGIRLNMYERDFYRLLPPESARLSNILAARRVEQRARVRKAQTLALKEEILLAVSKLVGRGLRPTLRAICRELGLRGVPVGHREAGPLVRDLVRNVPIANRSVSGNK